MLASQAAQRKMWETDLQQAGTIHAQIQSDGRKQAAERWKIVQDLRTKIFAETQEVTLHKAKIADKAYSLFDSYMRA